MTTGTPDFDVLLDRANFGREPSDHYTERLNALDNIVRECMHVSHRYGGIPAPTSQHFYASVLFTTLVTKGVSLLSLAPHSTWAAKQIEHWDYATAAVIARTMLEARLAFYYLCTDSCSTEEWQCRWNIFNLHDCTARIRLFDALGKQDQVDGFREQAKELHERLKTNEFFNSLPSGQQKKLLNGQTAYLMPLEDIAELAGMEKANFRFLYVLLSSHVHSLPMSFYRMGDMDEDRGRGLPSHTEENYTSLCLSLACSLLVSTRDEVHALFEGLSKPVNESYDAQEVEHKIEEMVNNPDGFPVGAKVDIFQSERVKVEVTRVDAENIEMRYYHMPSNDLVLLRFDGEKGVGLTDIDPFFWNVELDGLRPTETMMQQLADHRYAFKVDHVEQKLSFKTER